MILGEKLGKKDFVKVLDFGIAARRDAADTQKEQKLTQQGMVLGTPPYMSPEQFTGAELDRRSDIYSLGVMTYEMLTGSLPFNATTPWQWATEHMTAQPFPIEQRPLGYGIPKSMREAVMRSLAKSPSERPSTVVAFVAELKAGLAAPVNVTEPTQAMQAVLPSEQRAVEVSAKTGVLPAARQTSTQRSPEASSGTEAGLSALQPAAAKRSNVGLFAGALALVAALGVGAWIASGGPGSTAAAPPEAESKGPGSATSSTPEPAPAPPTPAPPVISPPVPPTATPIPGPAASGGTSATVPVPTPTPGPSTTSTTTPPKGPTVAPVPCSECIGLIGSGSWSRAAKAYGSCDGAGQKQCSAKAKREAPEQAERAASAHKCSQVQTILAGATAMGAATTRVKTAAEKCN